MDLHADLDAEFFEFGVSAVGGACRVPLPVPLFADGVAAQPRLFLEKEKIGIAQTIGGAESTRATAHDHNVVFGRGLWQPKPCTVAHLMANDIRLAAQLGPQC